MSNKKKAKKLRTPNVAAKAAVATQTAAGQAASTQARGGGAEPAMQPRLSRAAPAGPVATFDYTYVKKDLARIGILAASFIVVLVALSFFIH